MNIKLAQKVTVAPLAYAILRGTNGAEVGRLRACSVAPGGMGLTAPADVKTTAPVASVDLTYLTAGALYGVPVAAKE